MSAGSVTLNWLFYRVSYLYTIFVSNDLWQFLCIRGKFYRRTNCLHKKTVLWGMTVQHFLLHVCSASLHNFEIIICNHWLLPSFSLPPHQMLLTFVFLRLGRQIIHLNVQYRAVMHVNFGQISYWCYPPTRQILRCFNNWDEYIICLLHESSPLNTLRGIICHTSCPSREL